MMYKRFLVFAALLGSVICAKAQSLTARVNPFLGTATLWETADLGYVRHSESRTWGGETFPGATLPFAMVQATPVTQFHSGSGYQYEDQVIYGFGHTAKGHWNLLHIPLLPVTGPVNPADFASEFRHDRESAHPGYYQVFLERYGINAEVTTTLRCAYYRFAYRPEDEKLLLADLTRSNNQVSAWAIRQDGDHVFTGYQEGEGRMYFYAVSSLPVAEVGQRVGGKETRTVSLVRFRDSKGAEPLELRIGFSFVSVENARLNLEAELAGKDFATVRDEADATWEQLLGQIRVKGGTERQQNLFYSCLYHSLLWPCLRSDVNGDYLDVQGKVVNGGFRYYTNPSFWDDYRNKLILMGMLCPDVAVDVIRSITDKGEKGTGYMPTFFHGDHASTFVSGTWLRGIRGFDLERAYKLLLRNAIVPGRGGRIYLEEYLKQGWISDSGLPDIPFYDEYKGGVAKTLEYSYDDYATALVADVLGDTANRDLLLAHSRNYRNVFDPSTGFYRGRTDDGAWITPFNPYYPYYQHMYREANAWEVLFYPPHDIPGLISLYPSKAAVEAKLDSLFTEPYIGLEVDNMTAFIGNYCHGNQPDHNAPYMYSFIGKQPKTQALLNRILDEFYDMGAEKLALAGMNDAGEMTAWYVMNAIGIYTYSPADPEYLVTVPLFDEVHFTLGGGGRTFTIEKAGSGERIESVRVGNKKIRGLFVQHADLAAGKTLRILVSSRK